MEAVACSRQQWRSVVQTLVPERDSEGRVDDAVPGSGGEGQVDNAIEGARWRRTRQRSRRRWACGEEMTGLGFRSSGTLKKKNNSDRRGWLCQHTHR
jgi:hypothetical protein